MSRAWLDIRHASRENGRARAHLTAPFPLWLAVRLEMAQSDYCKAYERATKLLQRKGCLKGNRLALFVERRLLSGRARRLYTEALLLRRFATLNLRAARKIAKKADKQLGTVRQREVEVRSKRSPMHRACSATAGKCWIPHSTLIQPSSTAG